MKNKFLIFCVFFVIVIFPSWYIYQEFNSQNPEYQKKNPLNHTVLSKPLVQIVEKKLPAYLKDIVITNDGLKLIAVSGSHLYVIDSSNLEIIQTIELISKDEKERSFYWKTGHLILSPDQGYVLALDKLIDINTGKTQKVFDVESAIKEGYPLPIPLDISPNGNLGLIMLHSFSGNHLDRFAVFDLITGELVYSRRTGESIVNVFFAGNDRLLIFYKNGNLTIEDMKGQIIQVLNENVPRPKIGLTHVIVSGEENHKFKVIHTNPHIFIFNLETQKLDFKGKYEGNIFVLPNSPWVFYDYLFGYNTPNKNIGVTQIFFNTIARNMFTGATSEFRSSVNRGFINLHPTKKILFSYSSESLIAFKLSEELSQNIYPKQK